MKYLILGLLFLSACSTGPIRIRVANCEYLGGGLYECEKIQAPGPQRPAP